MKLLELKIGNFKGLKNFTLTTHGDNVSIYGDNATGKTTIIDSIFWLMFDKDSKFKSKFEIKKIDKEGSYVTQDCDVEGTFQNGDEQIKLKKIYKEKWTKKRGEAIKKLTGHTTDYSIDDVPCTKTEYKNKMSQIIDEETFKLLTNPYYFSQELPWEKRRHFVIGICGDVSDEDVISKSDELLKLKDILGDNNIDDHKKIITAKKAKINKEIEGIPIRIDEIQKGITDTDYEVDPKTIEALKNKIKEKEQELYNIQNGGGISEKKNKIQALKNEIQALKNNQESKRKREISDKQSKVNSLEFDISKKSHEHEYLKVEGTNIDRMIEAFKQNIKDAREEWKTINVSDFSHDDKCDKCGQVLPTEQKEKLEELFLLKKSNELEQIINLGKSESEKLSEEKQRKTEKQKEIEKIDTEIIDLNAILKTKEKELKDFKEKEPFPTKEMITKKEEKIELEEELKQLESGDIDDESSRILEEIIVLQNELTQKNDILADLKRIKEDLKRIVDLRNKEKQLSTEYEKIERDLFLIDEFTKTKVSMLESKVNSIFKLARFKMFEDQINGGIKDCCEVTFDGIPYNSGLNSAAKINVGLDIISVIQKHFQKTAPVFIDNCESVTKINDIDSQLICMHVSEMDKNLRIS